jgi:hypothetical protein
VPDWVFASAEGHVLEECNVRTVFARLLEEAGLRHIRIHDLRHSSSLLQQGESVVYVKQQLGHSSIQITVDTYGHLIRGANRIAVDRLDDAPTHLDATRAQPHPQNADAGDQPKSSVLNGEPRWNRTLKSVTVDVIDGVGRLAQTPDSKATCSSPAVDTIPRASLVILLGRGEIVETRQGRRGRYDVAAWRLI